MHKRCFILPLIIFFITFYSCKHDKSAPTCQQQTYTITPFLKQFEFKLGSYWIYTSPNSAQIDTMKLVASEGGLWNYPYCNNSPHNNPSNTNCLGNDNHCYQYEVYNVELKNRVFEGANFSDLHINYNYIFYGHSANYNSTTPRFLVTNTNDSLSSYGYFSKLEIKFDTLTISGTRYNNVYQMYYSPAWQKFKRIWWCAGIGFVKFEFINLQNQVETWYLNSSHVVI